MRGISVNLQKTLHKFKNICYNIESTKLRILRCAAGTGK